jgi:hypothetical protein
VIIFIADILTNNYSVEVQEFRHNLKEGEEINKLFTRDGKLLKYHTTLIGIGVTKQEKNQARKVFLKEQDVDSLAALL